MNYEKLNLTEVVELKKKLNKIGINTEIHLQGKYKAYAYLDGKKALIVKRNNKIYITRHLQQNYKYWEDIKEIELVMRIRNLFKTPLTKVFTPINFI